MRSGKLGPLSVLIIDVDHFKAINDRFGHAVGDSALKIVSNLCNSAKRDSDISARIGGEEFALSLPETNETAVLQRFTFTWDHSVIPCERKTP
jgi:diguanylate cyclase (GGDEF)-like protein